nr:IgGFc-binding protein-like isoform X1 [Paramormyrops kingsleyae]
MNPLSPHIVSLTVQNDQTVHETLVVFLRLMRNECGNTSLDVLSHKRTHFWIILKSFGDTMQLSLVRVFIFSTLYPGFALSQNSGVKFITAFPENVAYYHPIPPTLQLLITSYQDNTWVNITVGTQGLEISNVLSDWEVWPVVLSSQERQWYNESQRTTCIYSNRPITVLSASSRNDSTEISVLYPVSSLDNEYFLTAPANAKTNESFNFVVVNEEDVNNLTVQGQDGGNDVHLQPYRSTQFPIDPQFLTQVNAEELVAVLLGNPCLEVGECGCSMAFEQLLPFSMWGKEYVLPALPAPSSLESLLVVGRAKDELKILSNPNLHLQFSTPRSLTLLGPGFLMNLLPMENWTYNFLLHTFSNFSNFALLVVETSEIDGLRLKPVCEVDCDEQSALSVNWTAVSTTVYSQGILELDTSKSTYLIWHLTSTMAVYTFGTHLYSNRSYGSTALSLPRVTGYLVLVRDGQNWTSALQQCQALGGALGSITNADVELQLTSLLKDSGLDGVWIGLRKSVFTGQWYWLSKAPLGTTYWANHEPKNNTQAWCAVASLEDDNIRWNSEICCSSHPFVCYM